MGKQVTDLALYARLLRYVRPYWRMFLISITSMVILAATSPAVAALLKPMMDGAFLNKDPHTMVMVPLLFVLLFVVRGFADFSSGAALHWVATRVVTDLRAEMFQRLLSLPGRFYDHHVTGKLISRFSFDVLQVKNAATNAITVVVRDTLAIIGLLGWMFYINWQLSQISLLCTPFIILIVLVARQRLRKMGRKVQETMGDINQVVSESIHNHKLIKLYEGQTQEAARFGLTNESNRRYTLKYAIAATATGPAIQLISAIAFAVIIYIATRQSAAGILTIGDFVSFVGAMTMLLTPLKRLIGINESLQKGLAACESIFAIMDQPPEQDTGASILERVQGQVEFRNVQFNYDTNGADALGGISFTVNPGETLALVGPSGSGKTTITSLLAGFYHPGRGSILIDGIDMKDCTLATLRANIALVSQDVMLFNDTVRNNIAYGALRDCTNAEVENAARAAHALEFINKMPEGFATVIGEKGQLLSGGQRQRLAIARALLKDAPILIMDEATSSLDTEAERHIQAALETIKKGRTCI
ncbi:MAG: lipid A export permease/ATP-binding protein MsbA, partial [Gammaproteobacteria bacterium]